MDIGQRIRFYRNRKGLTQTQLAEQSGLHPVSIRKYEAGMMKPREAQIRNLADALGINMFLLQEADYPKLRFDTDENIEDSIVFLLQIGVLTNNEIENDFHIKIHPVLAEFLKWELENI